MIAWHTLEYWFDTYCRRNEREKLVYLEKKIISINGLTEGKDIFFKDIPIGEKEFVHTAIIGNPSNPPLLFVHGFLGTIIYYTKLFPALAKHFCIYAIDCPGAGLSSRCHFSPKTSQEAVDYFIERIQSLKKALKLDQFYLAGHSMGAYCSFFYTLKNPEDVLCLFMLSPAGFREVDPEHPFYKSIKNPKTLGDKLGQWLNDFLNRRNLNFRDFLGFLGPVSRKLIYGMAKKAFKLEGEELSLMTEYSYHLSRMKTCWDKAAHLIFKDGPYAPDPIIKHVDFFKTQCFIYFG